MWPILLRVVVITGGALIVREVFSRRIRARIPEPVDPFSEAAATADLEFHADLARLARDHEDPAIQQRAGRAARLFKKYWLDRNAAGYSIAAGFHQPIYGHYCGAGWTGTGEAVDAIDGACKRHDEARAAAFG